MKHFKVLLGIFVLSASLLFTCITSNSDSAATWHNGTPAKIRGHYHSKETRYWGPSLPYKITRYTIQWKSAGLVWHGSGKARYRIIKHNWYQLRFVFSQTGQTDYYIVHYVSDHKLHLKERQLSEKHYQRMFTLVR